MKKIPPNSWVRCTCPNSTPEGAKKWKLPICPFSQENALFIGELNPKQQPGHSAVMLMSSGRTGILHTDELRLCTEDEC